MCVCVRACVRACVPSYMGACGSVRVSGCGVSGCGGACACADACVFVCVTSICSFHIN